MRTHLQRTTVLLLAFGLLLSSCTGGNTPPTPTQINAPALPAEVFAPLPNRPSAASMNVQTMTSDGSTVLMIANAVGRTSVPTFRRSTDGGATWTDGRLTDDAARATRVGEEATGLAAVATAGDERAWVVLGDRDQERIAWTSRDALSWDRHELTGLDPDQDSMSSIAGLPGGGFVGVGSVRHGAKWRPKAWTSPDGVNWTAHQIAGEGSLVEVAASRNGLVAVGSDELDKVTKGRSQRSLLFTSLDGGVHWQSVTVKEPADSGNFVSRLGNVVATPSGALVGGSYYSSDEGTYRPFLLRSTDLSRWTAASVIPSEGQSSGIAELISLGERVVAVNSFETSGKDDRMRILVERSESSGWVALGAPPADAEITAAVGAGSGDQAVVMVDVASAPPRTDQWTLQGERVTTAPVAPPADAALDVWPTSLLLVDHKPAAYGISQGADVVWLPGDNGFSVPTLVRDEPGDTVGTMAWSPSQGFMATASHGSEYAFTLHSPDGQAWRRSAAATTFNKVKQYHGTWLNDVVWANDRWVVVGDKTTNGDIRASALAYTSKDSRTWTEGLPTKVIARGDWYNSDSPLDDLHGLDKRGRSMNDVKALGTGLVAVGTTTSGDRTLPAAWVSSDNRHWRLTGLPTGDYAEGGLYSVQRVGEVLVGLGWVLRASSTKTIAAVWRSDDGGKHWSLQALEETRGSQLYATDTEFLRVELSTDRRTVTMHRSTDGQNWSPQPIPIDHLADGMELALGGGVADGTTLHLLVHLFNRLDAVTVVQTVAL